MFPNNELGVVNILFSFTLEHYVKLGKEEIRTESLDRVCSIGNKISEI